MVVSVSMSNYRSLVSPLSVLLPQTLIIWSSVLVLDFFIFFSLESLGQNVSGKNFPFSVINSQFSTAVLTVLKCFLHTHLNSTTTEPIKGASTVSKHRSKEYQPHGLCIYVQSFINKYASVFPFLFVQLRYIYFPSLSVFSCLHFSIFNGKHMCVYPTKRYTCTQAYICMYVFIYAHKYIYVSVCIFLFYYIHITILVL